MNSRGILTRAHFRDRPEAVAGYTFGTCRVTINRCTDSHVHQNIVSTTDMPIKARPFGCQEQFDWGADIHSVTYDGSLVIRVLRNRNKDDGIEVSFSQVDGFRLLDEVPLGEYWIADDFPSGYPVLEVFDGGWAKEEEKRLGYSQEQREWIIRTVGACVSVFSKHEPKIRDAIWPVKA